MFSYQDIFASKNRVLVVTAHPDDAVIFFGALMHKLVQDRKQVYVAVVTNGRRGSRDNVVTERELGHARLQEERRCLEVLGVPHQNLFCLDYADGEVESNLMLIGEIARLLREFKIDIVCTHEPGSQYVRLPGVAKYFVQHRDHRKTGEAVIDAVYPFSRDRSFFPEHIEAGLEPHTLTEILLSAEKGYNCILPFDDSVETKRQAMLEHVSQFTPEVVEHILKNFCYDNGYQEKYQYISLE